MPPNQLTGPGNIKFNVTFNTQQASQSVQTIQGALNSLQASARGALSSVLGSALGPFASPTGMMSNFVSPIGRAMDMFQGGIGQGMADRIGLGGTYKDIREGRSDFNANLNVSDRLIGLSREMGRAGMFTGKKGDRAMLAGMRDAMLPLEEAAGNAENIAADVMGSMLKADLRMGAIGKGAIGKNPFELYDEIQREMLERRNERSGW